MRSIVGRKCLITILLIHKYQIFLQFFFIQSFWALGACFEVLLALMIMPTLGWRWLLALSTVPVFIFACVCPVITVTLSLIGKILICLFNYLVATRECEILGSKRADRRSPCCPSKSSAWQRQTDACRSINRWRFVFLRWWRCCSSWIWSKFSYINVIWFTLEKSFETTTLSRTETHVSSPLVHLACLRFLLLRNGFNVHWTIGWCGQSRGGRRLPQS